MEAFIFDLDGTIIDSLTIAHKCFDEILEKKNLPLIDRNYLFRCMSENIDIKNILKKHLPEKDESFYDEIATNIRNSFYSVDYNVPLLPGVREVFEILKKKSFKIGIATGRQSNPDYEKKRLGFTGLKNFVDALSTGKEVINKKPEPDVILLCCERLEVSPGKCVVIGDSVNDVLAAKKIGSVSVAVTTGIDPKDRIKNVFPDILIDNLNELVEKMDG